MWDTFEMIYGVSSKYRTREDEHTRQRKNTTFNYFSKLRNIGKYVGNCITNKYLIVKNWKFNPTLKSKDGNLHEFREKSRKKKILEKLNELV